MGNVKAVEDLGYSRQQELAVKQFVCGNDVLCLPTGSEVLCTPLFISLFERGVALTWACAHALLQVLDLRLQGARATWQMKTNKKRDLKSWQCT